MLFLCTRSILRIKLGTLLLLLASLILALIQRMVKVKQTQEKYLVDRKKIHLKNFMEKGDIIRTHPCWTSYVEVRFKTMNMAANAVT